MVVRLGTHLNIYLFKIHVNGLVPRCLKNYLSCNKLTYTLRSSGEAPWRMPVPVEPLWQAHGRCLSPIWLLACGIHFLQNCEQFPLLLLWGWRLWCAKMSYLQQPYFCLANESSWFSLFRQSILYKAFPLPSTFLNILFSSKSCLVMKYLKYNGLSLVIQAWFNFLTLHSTHKGLFQHYISRKSMFFLSSVLRQECVSKRKGKPSVLVGSMKPISHA